MLKEYATQDIRNVCIIGHDGTGKSTLFDSMLFVGGQIDKIGSPDNGTLTSDYDDEEKLRKMSISSALGFLEFDGVKINIIDTPGKAGFVGEQRAALQITDLAIVVVDAVDGVQIETEKAWRYLKENRIPRIIFVNKMDKERANYQNVIENLRNSLKVNVATLCLPMGEADSFTGVVDIIEMKTYTPKGDGRDVTVGDVPGELMDTVKDARTNLIEQAAEGDDELIEKFLDGQDLTDAETKRGIDEQLLEARLSTVICGSATKVIGIKNLLRIIKDYVSAPSVIEEYNGHEAGKPHSSKVVIAAAQEPLSALCWKTYIDQYSGRFSYFKVTSGTLDTDIEVINSSKNEKERITKLYTMVGNKLVEVPKLNLGDLGVAVKLEKVSTSNTICDPKRPVEVDLLNLPHPVYSLAIDAKDKKDEDKLAQFFHKIMDENPTVEYAFNPETHETVLSGMGDLQLDIILEVLKEKHRIEVVTREPRVAYRETVTKKSEASYKHKKQSGGHGQYGEVYFRMWPLDRGAGYEFKNSIVGGVVPKQYIPGVQKGIDEAMKEGVLGKFQVVDAAVEIFDGSFHAVDSSEMSFKIASRNCFKEAMKAAGPQLLEPVMEVQVFVDKEYMGDVLNDVTTRRGRVLGMDNAEESGANVSVVNAQIPLAEMLRYSIDLKSMTQGKANFEMKFSHYDPLSGKAAEKVLEERKSFLQEGEE